MANFITDEDLNGAEYFLNQEGEALIRTKRNTVVFLNSTPAATDNTEGEKLAIPNDQANGFLMVNMVHLVKHGLTLENAAKCAFIRFLAVKEGLISPEFNLDAHFVSYNDAVRKDEDYDLETKFNALTEDKNEISGYLTAQWKLNARKMFCDIVCAVAYVFRIRGHHYLPAFQPLYERIWTRCLKTPENLPVSWELLSTVCLHAVFPTILDKFWASSMQNAFCAGTLSKRFKCAAAGTAAIIAIHKGILDVSTLFPGVIIRFKEEIEYLKDCMYRIENSRWVGSVNSVYYGVPRKRFDEDKIGILAAAVLAIYDTLTPGSTLTGSSALKRVATLAPVTGGALGAAAQRIVRSPEFTGVLLIKDAEKTGSTE